MDEDTRSALETLCSLDDKVLVSSGEGERCAAVVSACVPSRATITELIREMGPYLTHLDGHVRRRATNVLAALLEDSANKYAEGVAAAGAPGSSGAASSSSSSSSSTTLPPTPTFLAGKSESFRPLLSFFLDRLGDHPSVVPCIRAARAMLHVVEVNPSIAPTAAVTVSRALFAELHVQASEQPLRKAVFDLLGYILQTKAHSFALIGKALEGVAGGAGGMGMVGEPYALEFTVGLVQAIDGEKDPRCLISALRAAELALSQTGPASFGTHIASLTEELFDVTSCYFPITFTPPPNDPHGITKEMLSTSLRNVFAASPALAPYALPLLLDKIASSVPEAMRESLRTLVASASVWGVEGLRPHLMDLCSALRKLVTNPRGLSMEPGTMAVVGTLLPSIWLGSGGLDSRRIGPSAGSIGLNFSGDGPTHDVSGYSLFSLARERAPTNTTAAQPATAASAGGPPRPPALVTDIALEAIAEIARVLSVSAQAATAAAAAAAAASSSSASLIAAQPVWWTDFVGMMVRTCVTEVERAVESAVGRGSARVLVAIASASPHAFAAVADLVVPVIAEIHNDAHFHGRHTVHGALLALAAGLLHIIEPSLDHGGRSHPLTKYLETLYKVFFEALGETSVSAASATPLAAAEHSAAAAEKAESTSAGGVGVNSDGPTGTASGAARLPPRVIAGVAAAIEKRCIAAAGLADLAVRSPSSLLSEEQLDALVSRLSKLVLEDGDELVRAASLRALCTLAAVRNKTRAAVLRVTVPSLMSVAAAGGNAGGNAGGEAGASLTGQNALLALTQLSCTSSSPQLFNTIVPQLLDSALVTGPDGALSMRSSLAAESVAAIAQIASIAVDVGDASAVEGCLRKSTDAAATTPAPPPAAIALLRLAVDSVRAGTELPLRVRAAIELAARVLATAAASPAQDALRADATSLLLGQTPAAGSGLTTASAWFTPLAAGAATASVRLLPVFAKILSCSRKGAPVPQFAEIVSALVTAGLRLPTGELKGCDDPSLRAVAAAVAASPDMRDDDPAAWEETSAPALLAAEGAEAASSSDAFDVQRAAIHCAQAVGMALNRAPATGDAKSSFSAVVESVLSSCTAAAISGNSGGAGDVASSQRGVLFMASAAKGLAMRGHVSAGKFVSALLDLLVDPSTDARVMTLCARGLGNILQDAPQGHPFNKDAGAALSGIYRQKLFVTVMDKYNELRKGGESVGEAGAVTAAAGPTPASSSGGSGGKYADHPPLMLALCSMAANLPHSVLLAEVDKVLPIAVRALEVVAPAGGAGGGSSSSSGSGSAVMRRELTEAVAKSALLSLRTIVESAPASVSPHIHTLVPVLLRLAVRSDGASGSPLVRALAIDVIRGFSTGLPYHRLHPVKNIVVAGLVAALDDPKRAVRRRAAACRNDWLTVNA